MANKSIKICMVMIHTSFRKLLGIKAGRREKEGLSQTCHFKMLC